MLGLVLFTDLTSQMDMANHSGADYSMLIVHGVSRSQLRKHQANVPDIGTEEKEVRLPAVPILDNDAFNHLRAEKENSNWREASSKHSGHSYERNNKNEENKFIGTEEKDVRLPAVPILDNDAFILGLYINLM
ncbi:hypothetical protein Hanom_Chr05g00441121 [Helianthus anomalus]